MRVTRNNWWFTLDQPIRGYEEGEGGSSTEGGGSSEGEGNAAEGAGDGQGSSEGGQGGNSTTEDVSGLKSALEKERADRKTAEKALKAFQKAEENRTNAEKTEIQRATDNATRESQRVQKLAKGFRDRAVNEAVMAAAGKAKFRDPSDALRPEVLAAIGVEQDEDDPTQIEIDEKTVTEAIKKLAKNKPHYLLAEEKKTLSKSGSSFGGSSESANQTADEAAIARLYPALARRTR